MMSASDMDVYRSNAERQWCPGCSNHGILSALRNALSNLGKGPSDICLVSGIGQAAKLPHYIACNFFNGLHGRALPVASAIAGANPELSVIVTTGDGDCYGEGGNHFLHAIRRNPNMTLIVHNNGIYGLTKGQGSPTTDEGSVTSLLAEGVRLSQLNPLAIALTQGCTFVARGFAGDIPHLSTLIERAVNHRGMAYIDVVQPCIIWGVHPMDWYKDRIRPIDEGYDASDLWSALKLSMEWQESIPIGILYQVKPRPCFGEHIQGKLVDMGSQPIEMIQSMLDRYL